MKGEAAHISCPLIKRDVWMWVLHLQERFDTWGAEVFLMETPLMIDNRRRAVISLLQYHQLLKALYLHFGGK